MQNIAGLLSPSYSSRIEIYTYIYTSLKTQTTAHWMVNEKFYTYLVKDENRRRKGSKEWQFSCLGMTTARLSEIKIATTYRMNWKGLVVHRKLLKCFQIYTTTVSRLTSSYMWLVHECKIDGSVHKYVFLSTENEWSFACNKHSFKRCSLTEHRADFLSYFKLGKTSRRAVIKTFQPQHNQNRMNLKR